MGLITTYIAYKVGKRRGERDSEVVYVSDNRDPVCLNYESFCKNFGSCDGQECEYDDE